MVEQERTFDAFRGTLADKEHISEKALSESTLSATT
jgi:hypothetical protein